MNKIEMSEIVRSRFREICPLENVSEMDIVELEKDVHVAFSIIGYDPKNVCKAFKETLNSSNAVELCDFVYDVWRNDE